MILDKISEDYSTAIGHISFEITIQKSRSNQMLSPSLIDFTLESLMETIFRRTPSWLVKSFFTIK